MKNYKRYIINDVHDTACKLGVIYYFTAYPDDYSYKERVRYPFLTARNPRILRLLIDKVEETDIFLSVRGWQSLFEQTGIIPDGEKETWVRRETAREELARVFP